MHLENVDKMLAIFSIIQFADKHPKTFFKNIFKCILYIRWSQTIDIIWNVPSHYSDIIMSVMTSQITSLTVVYSVYSGTDQRKHQSSASLAFVWGIHRWPVNSPHKWPVMPKMFPFDDVIMKIHFLFNIIYVSSMIYLCKTFIVCHILL